MAAGPKTFNWKLQFFPKMDAGAKEYRQYIRQFPFAAFKALNDVARAFQSRQREWQLQAFQIRAKDFFRRAVKIQRDGFATRTRLRSIVEIDPEPRNVRIASSRQDIFDRQELGGVRKPAKSHLAIPTDEVARTGRGLIRKKDFPDQLKNEFVADFVRGGQGLFQRLGRRQRAFTKGGSRGQSLKDDPNVRFLYFLADEATITPRYNFFINANITWLTVWDEAYDRRLDEAFASIKPAK